MNYIWTKGPFPSLVCCLPKYVLLCIPSILKPEGDNQGERTNSPLNLILHQSILKWKLHQQSKTSKLIDVYPCWRRHAIKAPTARRQSYQKTGSVYSSKTCLWVVFLMLYELLFLHYLFLILCDYGSVYVFLLINRSFKNQKNPFPLSHACDLTAGLCATSLSRVLGWMCVFMTCCNTLWGDRGESFSSSCFFLFTYIKLNGKFSLKTLRAPTERHFWGVIWKNKQIMFYAIYCI